MKTTIVLCSTNRGVFGPTRKLINDLKAAGAMYMEQTGASCVALARNLGLTSACEAFDQAPQADTLVMLDDDMSSSANDVAMLVTMSRKLGRPCSMTYTNSDGGLCHAKLEGTPLWVSGLGLLAIPRRMILALRSESPTFKSGRRAAVYAFTEAKMSDGLWSSEDYTLTRRLGGVVLVPVGAGHLKVQSLHPNETQLGVVALSYTEFCNANL